MNVITGVYKSRRLGRSLGVNLYKSKTCNLDCIYCECGENSIYDKPSPYSFNEIIFEIDEASKVYSNFDYITFSGLGEPTIHPDFPKIIEYVNKKFNSKICIITNSTTFSHPAIYNALMSSDVIMPSLDSVNKKTFNQIDRPSDEVDLEDILSSFKMFTKEYRGEIYIEIFFSANINDTDEELDSFIEYLRDVTYSRIDINSLDRAAAIDGLLKISIEKRNYIQSYFERNGLKNINIV